MASWPRQLRMTGPGRALLERQDGVIAAADAELCARLDPEQAGQLRGLLDLVATGGRA